MDASITVPTPPRTRSEYLSAIDDYLKEMGHIQERIDRIQPDIDRLQAETRAIIDSLRAS